MKFGEKDFSEYWKIVKMPTYVLVGWSVLGLIISIASYSAYTTVFTPATGWILALAAFGFIGWTAVKDNKGSVKTASWAGCLSGLMSGLVGAVAGVIMFYYVPEVSQAAISQAAQQGVDAESLKTFMQIGVYFGVILGPIINAAVGAGISAISGLIAKKV